jgi:toxin ParE1/3/4
MAGEVPMIEAQVHPEAKKEFAAALETSLSPGRFRRDLESVFALILANPLIGNPDTGLRDVREYHMTRLPYSIVYTLDGKILRIHAFAHVKRRRGYWKDRLA